MNWVYLSIDIFIHFIVSKCFFKALKIGSPEISFEYFENFLAFTFVLTLMILNLINIQVKDVEEMD